METVEFDSHQFNTDPGKQREPIPGYTLREQIGTGGSGEVWLADAPGGLKKALKIVYGSIEASRAERELAALQHIKLVQHPMLLSMERIEIVDQQLIIVSELADGCLKDRFNQCVKEGKIGIERDELLQHLTDAADALDFLIREHNLQHLDVKPENLLLLSNRVKVGDFGLVKDLSEMQSSGVHGLTPIYAPPELFDGKPSRNSDQYSLAIVFQHMLTGELPFAGRTTAQLVAQHLHSDPNTEPLPFFDRPIIEKALSKNPMLRFATCRELVDRLAEAPRKSSTKQVRRQNSSNGLLSTESSANNSKFNSTTDFNAGITHHEERATAKPPSHEAEIKILKPILSPPLNEVKPTLFIGVGGMGSRIISEVKRFMDENDLPGDIVDKMNFLLLDSDTDNLKRHRYVDENEFFQQDELVAAPLGQSSDYRDRVNRLTEWINRRWLFAIPRTQRPEGIRPLGRLALIDHFDEIVDRLRSAIGKTTQQAPRSDVDDPNVDTHQDDATTPRVYLVGSTCGGTSGGTLFDLAFTTRTLLREMGFPDKYVCGVLTHGTEAAANNQDLMIANSMAFLSELQFFSDISNHFPGEPSCGVPRFEHDSAPFAHTYFVHMGHRAEPSRLNERIAEVANFLLANSAWQAGDAFESLRAEDKEYQKGQDENIQMRTLAFRRVSADKMAIEKEVKRLTRDFFQQRVLRCGLHEEASAINDESANHSTTSQDSNASHQKRCRQFLLDSRLTHDQLRIHTKQLLMQKIGATPIQLYQAIYDHHSMELTEDAKGTADLSPAEIQRIVTDITFYRGVDPRPGSLNLQLTLMELMKGVLAERQAKMKSFLEATLKTPGRHFAGAKIAIEEWTQSLRDLQRVFELRVAEHQRNNADAIARDGLGEFTLDQGENLSEPAGRKTLVGYGIDQLELAIDMVIAVHVRCLAEVVKQHGVALAKSETSLSETLDKFDASLEGVDGEQETSTAGSLSETIAGERDAPPNRMDSIDQDFSAQIQSDDSSLLDLGHSESRSWGPFVEKVQNLARCAVGNVIANDQTSDDTQVIGQGLANRPELASLVNSPFSLVQPEIPDWGGDVRLIQCLPDANQSECLDHKDSELADHVQRLPIADTNVSVCIETSHIPVSTVIESLGAGRGDVIEAARRLHSREDIEWEQPE